MIRLFVLLLLLHITRATEDQNHLHWVCFHYHKTGSEFCQNIARRIGQHCNVSFGFDEGFNFGKLRSYEYYRLMHPDLLTQNDLIATRPLAMAESWQRIFSIPGHSYRIILMTRDPFEIILSAYKYHTQVPAPESWLEKAGPICPNATQLMPTLSIIGQFHGNPSTVIQWGYDAIAACELAVDMFPPNATYQHVLHHSRNMKRPGHTAFNRTAERAYMSSIYKYHHNHTAHSFDVYPGIRMQAFGSLGEIVYMAATKLFEVPSMSLTMQLDDFGVGNLTHFRSGARRMMEFFLRGVTPSAACPLCSCLNISTAMQLVEEASFVSLVPSNSTLSRNVTQSSSRNSTTALKRTSHFTHHLMPHKVKHAYIHRLAQDPALGPLLGLLAEIVNTPTETQRGSSLIDLGMKNAAEARKSGIRPLRRER